MKESGSTSESATWLTCNSDQDLECRSRTSVLGNRLADLSLPDLDSKRILVVEDSYFIATDIASALSAAGAQVLGPCPSACAARELLARDTPTHAVVDLNLNEGGPRFEVAHLLRSRGIPFIFVTGYDLHVLAPEFSAISCLQKPLSYRDVVQAIGRM
jgi:DNA-binding response OmpR family regulator